RRTLLGTTPSYPRRPGYSWADPRSRLRQTSLVRCMTVHPDAPSDPPPQRCDFPAVQAWMSRAHEGAGAERSDEPRSTDDDAEEVMDTPTTYRGTTGRTDRSVERIGR